MAKKIETLEVLESAEIGEIGEVAPATQVENKPETPNPDTLQHLNTLAATHRVPGWQQAALARLMGWEDGKMVTDAEYRTALDLLGNRKQGGGRQ